MILRRITLATTLITLLSMSALAAEPSWSALIVIRDVGGDFTTDAPDHPTTEPTHLEIDPGDAKDKPFFKMDVTKGDSASHIDRVIGVENTTSIHVATPIVVKVGSEALCKAASDLLSKKADVVSATCFQTN